MTLLRLAAESPVVSPAEARRVLDESRGLFDRLMCDSAGQAAEQAERAGSGCGDNYYLDDPVEAKHLSLFMDAVRLRAGRRPHVLVSACGDGLEAEVLAGNGFEVTAFDFSPCAVEQARVRLARGGLRASLSVADLTALRPQDFRGPFDGVMFAQAAAFLPVTRGDRLFLDALTGLARRASRGIFYYSTTRYPDPVYLREWSLRGQTYGSTPLYGRDPGQARMALQRQGHEVIHTEHFRSGGGPDDYWNDYLLTRGPRAGLRSGRRRLTPHPRRTWYRP